MNLLFTKYFDKLLIEKIKFHLQDPNYQLSEMIDIENGPLSSLETTTILRLNVSIFSQNSRKARAIILLFSV